MAAAASLADGKRCVEAAACAFPLWRDTAPAERRRLLLEAAEQMLLRRRIYRRHGGGDHMTALGRI